MRPFLAACFLTLPTIAAAETPVLTVMTYDSFTSEWGPGPAVEKAFEEHCGCDLRFVTGGDGAALLARLQLEGATSEADVVLGLDTNLTAQARATGLFAPHGAPAATALPVAWQDDLFLPYDWGWFAFVYDTSRTAMPPEDFRAQVDPFADTSGLLGRYHDAQVRNFDGQPELTEMDALVAYLQMLGTLVDFTTYDDATGYR